VYSTERVITKDYDLLGTFELSCLPSALFYKTDIQVSFDIDTSGILSAQVVNEPTLEGNKVTLTHDKGQLSKEEIERMMKDAEKYRAEEEEQKQTISATNALESYCFKMKWDVQYTLLGKFSDSYITAVMGKCNDIIRWVDDNRLAKKEEFELQHKELEELCSPIMKLYQGGFLRAGGPTPGAGGAAPFLMKLH
jgi:L1 cell adhesion molecule like protein